MLEALFAGDVGTPTPPQRLMEEPFTLQELDRAWGRMKVDRAPDEFGLVAELLHHCPRELRTLLLELFNKVLRDGLLPDTWCKSKGFVLQSMHLHVLKEPSGVANGAVAKAT